MIKVTDIARDMLGNVLSEHPGKYIRIIVDGVG